MALSSFSSRTCVHLDLAGIDQTVQRLVKSLPQGLAAFVAEMSTFILEAPSLSMSSHQLIGAGAFSRSVPKQAVTLSSRPSTSPLSPPHSSYSSSSSRTILPLPSSSLRPKSAFPSPLTPPSAPFPSRLAPTFGVSDLVSKVMSTSKLSAHVFLLALLYIDRYKKSTGGSGVVGLDGGVELVFMSALVIANKYLDDNTFTNQTFAEISSIPLLELNRAESRFLKQISFDLWIPDFSSFLSRLSQLQTDRHESLASFELSAEPPIHQLPDLHPSFQWPTSSQVIAPSTSYPKMAAYPSPRLSYPNHLAYNFPLPQRSSFDLNPYRTVKRSASQAFSPSVASIPSAGAFSSRSSTHPTMVPSYNLYSSSHESHPPPAKRRNLLHPLAYPSYLPAASSQQLPNQAFNLSRPTQPPQPSYHDVSLASASSSRAQSPNENIPNPSLNFNTRIFDSLPNLDASRSAFSHRHPLSNYNNPYQLLLAPSHCLPATASYAAPSSLAYPLQPVPITSSFPVSSAPDVTSRPRAYSSDSASTQQASYVSSSPARQHVGQASPVSSYDSNEQGDWAAEEDTKLAATLHFGSRGYNLEGWRNGIVGAVRV